MKRRYANKVKGEYIQKRIEEDFFKGYVAFVTIKDVENPLIVNDGIKDVCIKNNNYEWFEVYPDNEHYAITIMFDDKNNLIEWYFDISKEIGIENGIPYEDDLYLDLVVAPDGRIFILDEDELLDALDKDDITQSDVDLAYDTLNMLENKYVNNLEELKFLTNRISGIFNSKSKI